MQIQNIKKNNSFGLLPQAMLPPMPPAIVKACPGWLAEGKNAVNYLREAGVTLKKGRKFVDIFDGEDNILGGGITRPTNAKIVEDFVRQIMEIRKEFAEFTDSTIKVVGQNTRANAPIITKKLKGPGRTNIDKSTTRKQSV